MEQKPGGYAREASGGSLPWRGSGISQAGRTGTGPPQLWGNGIWSVIRMNAWVPGLGVRKGIRQLVRNSGVAPAVLGSHTINF